MNKRIEELAVSSGIYDSLCDPYDALKNGDYYSSIKVDLEKFAELIVQECARVIADNEFAKDCDTFLMESYAKGMRYSAHLIKEHFGVE